MVISLCCRIKTSKQYLAVALGFLYQLNCLEFSKGARKEWNHKLAPDGKMCISQFYILGEERGIKGERGGLTSY